MFWKLFKGRKNGGREMKEDNLMKNGSGYFDAVAYSAMRKAELEKDNKKFDEPMTAEEIKKREAYLRQREEDITFVNRRDIYRFHRLLNLLKEMCNLADFEVVGHIVLKDKRTGRIWK